MSITALLLLLSLAGDPPATGFITTPIGMAPAAVTSFGSAVHDGWLYVLGGARGRPHHYDRLSQSPLFARMNLANPTDWEMLPETTALQSVALVTFGDGLVRVGGMRSLNEPGTEQNNISVDQVERYDPANRTWTPLPPLPRPRSSHDAVVVGSHLYVAGGWRLGGTGEEVEWLDSVIRIDLRAKRPAWEEFATAPTRRRALAVAAIGGHLYLMGGITDRGRTTTLVEVLDLESKQWIDAPDIPRGTMHGFGMSAFGVDGRVVASAMAGHILSHAPGEKEWRKDGRLAFPRFFHRLVPDGHGGLYCVGGAGLGGRIRHVEHLRPARRDTSIHMATFDVPYAGRAKNRQAAVLTGQSLILSGGNTSLRDHDFAAADFTDETWILDLATMRAARGRPFPSRMQSMASVVTRGGRAAEALAVGGFAFATPAARTVGSVHRYHARKQTWERVDVGMPARSQVRVATHGDAIWIFGGLEYDPTRSGPARFRHPLEVLRWEHDGTAPAFEDTGIRLPRPRRAHAAASLDGKYYLVGGMCDGFEVVDTCDVFDFATKEWSQIPSPTQVRVNGHLLAIAGKLYLVGGTAQRGDDMTPARSIECFDPARGTWKTIVESIPLPAKHLHAFAFNDRLLLVSTQNDESVIEVAIVTL